MNKYIIIVMKNRTWGSTSCTIRFEEGTIQSHPLHSTHEETECFIMGEAVRIGFIEEVIFVLDLEGWGRV